MIWYYLLDVEVAAAIVAHPLRRPEGVLVNWVLRRYGLQTTALLRERLGYWGVLVFLPLYGVLGGNLLWRVVYKAIYDFLNGCVDERANLAWLDEQPYKPSQQYLGCVHGPMITATVMAWVATAAFALFVLVVLTFITNAFIEERCEKVTIVGVRPWRPVIRRIYRVCGWSALVLAIITLIVMAPSS
ncbi:MAG: hypothetical protein JWP06_172 [Candidatus Saccharibacteria bacterium]|nr:hypothetical protein [Candidatus Saccharibacteria bacterium]